MPPSPHDSLRLPSIDGLLAFEATARLGSYERAATELALTASAVAKRVAALEDRLGVALFARLGRAIAPTVAGREYLGQVREALQLLTAIPQHRRGVVRREPLRVSAPPTFARQVLVPALPSFIAAHPAIEPEIVLSIPFLDVRGAESDVDVGLAEPGEDDRVLMHDVVTPMAAPALLARHAAVQSPADLLALPLLRTPIEPWQPWFRAAGLDAGEPTQGARLVDLGLTLEAAARAQGVALARPTLALPWLERGELRPLLDCRFTPPRQYLVRHCAATPAADAFADWLQATCHQQLAAAHTYLGKPASANDRPAAGA